MLKFEVNISTMFKEMPLLERFDAAKFYGFNAVEIDSPYEYSIRDLTYAREHAGVAVEMISSPKTDLVYEYKRPEAEKMFGIAAHPGRELDFKSSIISGGRYCDFLKCPILNILAGKIPANVSLEEYEAVFIKNLKSAADILENVTSFP